MVEFRVKHFLWRLIESKYVKLMFFPVNGIEISKYFKITLYVKLYIGTVDKTMLL